MLEEFGGRACMIKGVALRKSSKQRVSPDARLPANRKAKDAERDEVQMMMQPASDEEVRQQTPSPAKVDGRVVS